MALGPHVFRTIGLNHKEVDTRTEAVWAEFARWGLTHGAQFHGMQRPSVTIRGVLYPDVTGGKPDYDAIRLTQVMGRPVPMLRLGAGFLGLMMGMVTIERVGDLTAYGGRKIAFDVDVKGYQ